MAKRHPFNCECERCDEKLDIPFEVRPFKGWPMGTAEDRAKAKQLRAQAVARALELESD